MTVDVIGAGLAGCEAAWALANAGIDVRLFEMKPEKYSPAHHNPNFAELVCSNSLKAMRPGSAAGMLKEEMRILGSLLLPCAEETRVAAGGALAVDRDAFSLLVTEKVRSHNRINIVNREINEIQTENPVVIATGPLTSDAMSAEIERICGGNLSFYDAAAPIVTFDSIDKKKVFFGARYNRGEDDYINCPFSKIDYDKFYDNLVSAEPAGLSDFDKPAVYEGCMPIEVMAKRGRDTIRYGPLRPVGLKDPQTGRRPWANVQLRRENRDGTLYNLVGFQTNLKFGEQKRVFSMIPGLENAEFVRYGVMHRNTFIDSPRLLDNTFCFRKNRNLYFAGQITGVEGYMESAMSGLLVGIHLARRLKRLPALTLPGDTMCGALSRHVSDGGTADYQPMGANMGLLPALDETVRDKQRRYELLAERGLARLREELTACGGLPQEER